MPQHVRDDHLGPVRQVHFGRANGLGQAATSGLAVMPAICVTTTTEPGASHGTELNHPGPRPDRWTGAPARCRPAAAQPAGAALSGSGRRRRPTLPNSGRCEFARTSRRGHAVMDFGAREGQSQSRCVFTYSPELPVNCGSCWMLPGGHRI